MASHSNTFVYFTRLASFPFLIVICDKYKYILPWNMAITDFIGKRCKT